MASTLNTYSQPFSAEQYFSTQPRPPHLDDILQGVRDFVETSRQRGRRIALVTSGGTTVPLELNVCVIDLDFRRTTLNKHSIEFAFSITSLLVSIWITICAWLPNLNVDSNYRHRTRGATSAEYFLENGYAVIFLHRQFSQQPFLRHYSHSTNPFLDFLTIENSTCSGSDSDQSTPVITVNPPAEGFPLLLRVLRADKQVKQDGTLHTVTFVTINDYLFLLRGIAGILGSGEGHGQDTLYYLAAAVSDFFLPRQKLSEHKIQSGKGSLLIEMDQVPKILKPLVDEWTPKGYILETDPLLLVPKARAALERYGHQLVIGNELHTRKYEVVFVERKTERQIGSGPSSDGDFTEEWIRIGEHDDIEIEKLIVEKLMAKHEAWIRKKQTMAS
ncbi:hypothetical protein FRC17_011148 [Serendipita sp. 399]|nr:hypothetical protein FRC17_011148 [Serendipita sp. 399]